MRTRPFFGVAFVHTGSSFLGPRCNVIPASRSCSKALLVSKALRSILPRVKLYATSPQGSEYSDPVEGLRIPEKWLTPANALKESSWLGDALLKWLDAEYCPEETNREISRVAAQSYYRSLVGSETDLGNILLTMAQDLEAVSYKESFHGAFSSANAAIDLILHRIHHPDSHCQ